MMFYVSLHAFSCSLHIRGDFLTILEQEVLAHAPGQNAVQLGLENTYPFISEDRIWGLDIQSWIIYAESYLGYQLPSEFESIRDTSSYDTVRTSHLLVLLYVGTLYPNFATGCMYVQEFSRPC
jgi:hypothetical protein